MNEPIRPLLQKPPRSEERVLTADLEAFAATTHAYAGQLERRVALLEAALRSATQHAGEVVLARTVRLHLLATLRTLGIPIPRDRGLR